MRIGVATGNREKVQGVAEAAALFFPGAPVVQVPPPELPKALPRDGEVLAGARARATAALARGFELGVGVESGLLSTPWSPLPLLVTLVLVSDGEEEAWATSAAFSLPPGLIDEENPGGGPGGTVARITGGRILRKELVREAAVLAFSQLRLRTPS